MQQPSAEYIANQVGQALAEDIGDGDITALLIDPQTMAEAGIYCRQKAVACGVEWVEQSFLQLDANCRIHWQVRDGDDVQTDQQLCQITGTARTLLTAERTALNFLQTLSGVATISRHIAQSVAGSKVRIVDTRKTIPGLRQAQKYAVAVGGCSNHRHGLYDAFLIKENHITSSENIADVLLKARALQPNVMLEIEVENIEQLQQAVEAGADRIMLDNMSLEQITAAVELVAGRVELEVSGNVSAEMLPQLAASGIDIISMGALTKHVQAVDYSMRFREL